MLATKPARLRHAAGMGDHFDMLAHRVGIDCDPFGLVAHNKAALEALLVGGDAGRTGVLVALQRLDTAQREHEASAALDEVGAGSQRPGDGTWRQQFARGDDADPVFQPVALEYRHGYGQAFADCQADIVHQRHRGRAGPAIAAIDGEEVGRALGSTLRYLFAHLLEPAIGPDDGLESDRLAGDFADMPYHVEQAANIVELGMAIGGNRCLANRNAADCRNVPRDFLGRQDAALARFGALREFELEHAHLFVRGHFPQIAVGQAAFRVADAVFRGANLENDVATALQMHGRQAALTGIHPDPGLRRAA